MLSKCVILWGYRKEKINLKVKGVLICCNWFQDLKPCPAHVTTNAGSAGNARHQRAILESHDSQGLLSHICLSQLASRRLALETMIAFFPGNWWSMTLSKHSPSGPLCIFAKEGWFISHLTNQLPMLYVWRRRTPWVLLQFLQVLHVRNDGSSASSIPLCLTSAHL